MPVGDGGGVVVVVVAVDLERLSEEVAVDCRLSMCDVDDGALWL